MLFCLSLCDETKRVILDLGEVLAMVEGRDWQEAREEAELHPALDAFMYRAGWGWERRWPRWLSRRICVIVAHPMDERECTCKI